MSKPVYSIDAPDQARLKIARLKIETILRTHDVAGVVVLHTPGMAETFYDICPSYSCVWIDEAAGALRVKSKLAAYAPADATATQAEAARKVQLHDQAASANMAAAFAGELGNLATMFRHAERAVSFVTRAEHTAAEFVADPSEAKPS